jgi:hypothetical protein
LDTWLRNTLPGLVDNHLDPGPEASVSTLDCLHGLNAAMDDAVRPISDPLQAERGNLGGLHPKQSQEQEVETED